MSDEEKKAIEILKDREYDFDELYCTFRQSFIKPYDKSIGIILELIEKQSKEIEELKAINKMQKYRIEVIDEREFISKDKIKAKIEEVKEIKNEHSKSFNWEDWKDEEVYTEIELWLQSLLEKE